MIGDTIGGYRILEKLGEGGIGEVYRALDPMLDREVAVKVLRPELAAREDVRERFRVEARTLAALHHPNIAGIYAFHGHGTAPMMVMELVPGRNLEQHLASTSLTVPEALDLVLQAARGLSCAHGRDIIHRDIKPANLMIDATGQVRITDFGIARIVGANRLTQEGAVIGTACYMAPEQIRGEQADARSDIYALAIVLYELLAKRPPFGGDSDYEILRSQVERRPPPLRLCRPDIPKSVERFLARALQKRPEDRHQSAEEVIADLSAARDECLAAEAADCALPEAARGIRGRMAGGIRDRIPLIALGVAGALGIAGALGVAGALMAATGGFAWISPAATSPGAVPDFQPGPVQHAEPIVPLPAPVSPSSVQPAANPPRAVAHQPEPAASPPQTAAQQPGLERNTPVLESQVGAIAQPAAPPWPEQPPTQPPTQPPEQLPSAPPDAEVSVPAVPEPIVQAPAVPEPVVQAPPAVGQAAPPPDPGPSDKADRPQQGGSRSGTGKPPAGPALARKPVLPCSSAWSVNWHAAPAKPCAR